MYYKSNEVNFIRITREENRLARIIINHHVGMQGSHPFLFILIQFLGKTFDKTPIFCFAVEKGSGGSYLNEFLFFTGTRSPKTESKLKKRSLAMKNGKKKGKFGIHWNLKSLNTADVCGKAKIK